MSKRVVTTQRTGKIWKLGMLIGVIVMVVGLVRLGLEMPHHAPIIAAGVAITIVSKVGAWWFHG